MSTDIDPSTLGNVQLKNALREINLSKLYPEGGSAPPVRQINSQSLDYKIIQKCQAMSRGQRRKYYKNMHNLLFPTLSWDDFNKQLK